MYLGGVSVYQDYFFTRLKTVKDEFVNMRPTPTCLCDPACRCGSDQRPQHYQHTNHVIDFLKGLSDSFGTVRSQIVLMDPTSRVFALVLQHERHLSSDGT